MQPRTVTVSLRIESLPLPPEDFAELRCFACGVNLNWHQPDLGSPCRMLGICLGCGRWFLLDLTLDADDSLLVLLPDGPQLRNVLSIALRRSRDCDQDQPRPRGV